MYKYDFEKEKIKYGDMYIEELEDYLLDNRIREFSMDINHGFLNANKYIKSISFNNKKDYEFFLENYKHSSYLNYCSNNLLSNSQNVINQILSNQYEIEGVINNFKDNGISKYKIKTIDDPDDNKILLFSTENNSMFLRINYQKEEFSIKDSFLLKNNQKFIRNIIGLDDEVPSGYDWALFYNIGDVKYGEDGDLIRLDLKEVNSILKEMYIMKKENSDKLSIDNFKRGI